MFTTRVQTLLVCSMSAVLSACSSSTPTAPSAAPIAQPVTVTLVQGSETGAVPHPVRLAFDGVVASCHDTANASCLPSSFAPKLRVQLDGAPFVAMPVEPLGLERRFQGSVVGRVAGEVRTYLFLVDALQEARGGWVATVVVRRGLEM